MKHTQKFFWTIIVGVGILFQSGCKDNNDNLNPTCSTRIVYLAGAEFNTMSDIAFIWESDADTFQNTKLNLDMDSYAEAVSVFVDGDDVYAAGHEYNDGSLSIAKLWKNGVGINLSDGNVRAAAKSVFISDGDVYVAGYEENENQSVARVWKNGVVTHEIDEQENTRANAIYVSGDHIYVAGYRGSGDNRTAMLWKNGVGTDLSDGTNQANALSIAVSGNDVYVAGYESNGSKLVAKVWKNGGRNRFK